MRRQVSIDREMSRAEDASRARNTERREVSFFLVFVVKKVALIDRLASPSTFSFRENYIAPNQVSKKVAFYLNLNNNNNNNKIYL